MVDRYEKLVALQKRVFEASRAANLLLDYERRQARPDADEYARRWISYRPEAPYYELWKKLVELVNRRIDKFLRFAMDNFEIEYTQKNSDLLNIFLKKSSARPDTLDVRVLRELPASVLSTLILSRMIMDEHCPINTLSLRHMGEHVNRVRPLLSYAPKVCPCCNRPYERA